MNRRDFLSFAAVAPVAVPMVVASALAAPSPVFIGIDLASKGSRMGLAIWQRDVLKQISLIHGRIMSDADIDSFERLFVGAFNKIGSPTPFPTADQDGSRQSAQASADLSPNSASRLDRSWGAYVDEGRVGT